MIYARLFGRKRRWEIGRRGQIATTADRPKLRWDFGRQHLLFEDFPRSHNLVLLGQPPLMHALALSINEEIRSRVTYSVLLPRLGPEAIERFILDQFDLAGLGHNVFTQDALALVVRSAEGLLRRTRNLCLGALIEAVRDQTRTVDLKQVNRVLIQPHWRKDYDAPAPS
jgi:MSHA biogenesis protein MshM